MSLAILPEQSRKLRGNKRLASDDRKGLTLFMMLGKKTHLLHDIGCEGE
ncbi:Uncharacterised protein [Mycobacterium tuberculosis]|nr:Uncharacterised protein [Mycobacterium tuberculosis]